MRTLLHATPLRSLTWALVALVAGIALLSSFVNVLHGAVQRGEWKAKHGHAPVWTTAQVDESHGRRQASSPSDDADVLPPQDVAAVLQVVAR